MKKSKTQFLIDKLNNISYAGDEVLLNTPIKELIKLAKDADNAYYNTGEPIMSDEAYDRLESIISIIDPNNEYLNKVGAPASNSSVHVDLPVKLFSQDKKKTEKDVNSWLSNYGEKVVISYKLDGISAMFYNLPSKEPKLYSRGTSEKGQDLSRLLEFLNIPSKVDCIARGELIISKSNYKKLLSQYENGKIEFKSNKFPSNGRSLVAGQVNSKSPDPEIMKYVEFIAYELIEPNLIASEQLSWLKKHKFNVVSYSLVNSINFNKLVDLLNDAKQKSKYDIDGLVVNSDSEIYAMPTSKNPKYSFAFKQESSEQKAEATIDYVEWNLTRFGVLSPLVWLKDSIEIGGTNIKKVSGKNAKFIETNGIGAGAKVIIVRSGDVIPNIHSVIKKAKQVDYPEVPYVWDKTNTNFELNSKPRKKAKLDTDSENSEDLNDAELEIKAKKIENFFEKLKIPEFGRSTIDKLIENNYNTIPKIVKMKQRDFLTLNNVKEKMAEKLYNNLQVGISSASPEMWVAASNIMGKGIGSRKIKALLVEIPDILTIKRNEEELYDLIIEVDGFADITARQVAENLLDFQNFIKSLKLSNINLEGKKPKKLSSNKLNNMVVVFTGFRDAELEEKIKSNGGEIGSGISGKTTHLLVSDKSSKSSKVKKAESAGVAILTPGEFKSQNKL